jgi:hypothetical protein
MRYARMLYCTSVNHITILPVSCIIPDFFLIFVLMSLHTTYQHLSVQHTPVLRMPVVVHTNTPIVSKSYYYTTFKDFDTFSPDYY